MNNFKQAERTYLTEPDVICNICGSPDVVTTLIKPLCENCRDTFIDIKEEEREEY